MKFKINEEFYRAKFKGEPKSEESSVCDEFIPLNEFEIARKRNSPI